MGEEEIPPDRETLMVPPLRQLPQRPGKNFCDRRHLDRPYHGAKNFDQTAPAPEHKPVPPGGFELSIDCTLKGTWRILTTTQDHKHELAVRCADARTGKKNVLVNARFPIWVCSRNGTTIEPLPEQSESTTA